MNPGQVKTWGSVEEYLKSKGFTVTSEKVDGGRIWRSKSKRHIIVSNPIDDMYPDFLWNDLAKRVQQIVP